MSQLRKEFEAWYSDNGALPGRTEKYSSGNYRLAHTSYSWVAWQEAAARYGTKDVLEGVRV